MAVYAQLANRLTSPAKPRPSPVSFNPELAAGTVTSDRHPEVTGWHTHRLDQLEYAWRGAVQLETREAKYLLPPQQAVWIPAGSAHQTSVGRGVQIVSAFFKPGAIRAAQRVRVLGASPLLREMLLHATRWPVDRPGPEDPTAATFFTALADVVSQAVDDSMALRLPTSRDPLIAAAMAATDARLPRATLAGVAAAIGTSERTLRRQFVAATGITWSAYVRQSRLLRAMALLPEPGSTVLDVATQVGFRSLSAFTRAFTAHVGETPSAYRRRASERIASPVLTARSRE